MNLLKFEMEMRRRTRPMARVGSPLEIRQSSKSVHPELCLVSTCKVEKISSIFSSFDLQKANLLKTIGFGGLLRMPFLKNLNEHLSLWLYQRFDFQTMCLHLDGGVDLHIREADVYLIFGIPFEGRAVNFGLNQSKETLRAFQHKLCSQTSSSCLTISFLEDILTKEYGPDLSDHEIDAFTIASVLVSMCYLLAPQTEHEFPTHLIKNFVPDVKPAEMNWAQFVLWTLGRAAVHARSQFSNGSKKILMYGCSLLLQVFYIDNLNFGPLTPYHILLPRASAYSHGLMSELIVSDCTGLSDDKLMLFGNRQVRPAIDVCYTRGWQDHVKMQAQLQCATIHDYLTSIEILTDGIHLVDNFATQLNHFISISQYAPEESLDSTKTSYLKFRSRINDNIHDLSTKAADLLKSRNLSLYHHHIPQDLPSTSNKRLSIGTSNQPVMKRTKCDVSGIPIGIRMVKHTTNILQPAIGPQVSSNQVVSGELQYARCPSSNVQAAADEQSPIYNSQVPYSQRKVVRSHSNFQKSTFDLDIQHPDMPWSNKSRCYLWMSNPSLPTDRLDCDWIVFTTPKPLSIRGHVVQQCLKLNGTFNVSIVDAIMVLWNYLDEKVYNHEKAHKRWRHFLPASFAETVNHNGDYLNSDLIRASFIGDHITYNVEDCQKIIIPVFGKRHTWSCYFWDFKLKTITVLDPFLMNSSAIKVRQNHQDTVFKLHTALFACKDHFFSGWDINPDGWADLYLTDVGRKCKPQNTGLYAVHFARSFCGAKIAFSLKNIHESNLSEARGEILYHMFTCDDNQGYKPKYLMEKIRLVEC